MRLRLIWGDIALFILFILVILFIFVIFVILFKLVCFVFMIRSKFETQDKRSEDVFVNHFVEKKPVNDQDKQAEAKAKEELIKRVFGEIKPGKPYNSNSSK